MTPYDEVYKYFLRKPDAYELKEILEENVELGKEYLNEFLESAIPKFTYCTKDLYDKDDILKQFNHQLSGLELEILATLMVVEYLTPILLDENLLKERLGSRDYQIFSPANLVKEVRETRKLYMDEANSLMSQYYYMGGY